MKKFYSLGIGLLLAVSLVHGQACYEVVQLPFYPFPFVGGNDTELYNDDIHTGVIPIGFDFCFFGNTYSELVIATNGYVTFDTSLANQFSSWSIQNAIPFADTSSNNVNYPKNAIMSPWQDINPGVASAGITYDTYGIAPYRKFVVSYKNVAMFSCTDQLFSNQIVLYETLNIIDINIASKTLCETWNAGAAIEGIHNIDGTEAYVVPGRNYPELWTSTGDSYRFIPQCYCESPEPIVMGSVMGKVFWDYNQDCILDPGEPGIPNVRFDIQPNDGIIWSGYQGNIAFMADPGSFTMEHSPNNPWYLTNICPMAPVDITVFQDSTVGPFLWGDTIVPYQDLEVTVGTTWLATCFNSQQQVSACNNGNVPAQNVTVKVLLADMLGLPVSNHPYTQSGDTLVWLFDWMDPGECRQILLNDSVPCDPSLLFEEVCLSAWIIWDSTDTDVTNNMDQGCFEILGSYDPNDKQAHGADHLATPFNDTSEVVLDESIEYLIRFQNTGTAAAYNITVRDTLSPLLDVSTIVPGASSHFYTAELRENVLTFHFPSIFLPDSATDPVGSQGWVYFAIAQSAGNGLGTVIPNSAAIYFDNNEPVITDTSFCTVSREEVVDTVDTVDTVSTGLNDASVYRALVPNPTSTSFRVLATDFSDVTIEVMDISGRVILTYANYTGQTIDVSSLSQGIYPVRVISPKGTSTTKLIRN